MPNGQIRPLDFGELLDQSFTLYRRHFASLYTISVVPGLLISPLAILLREPHGVVPTAANFGSYMLRLYGWLLVYSLVGFFSIAAAVYAVSEIYLGRKTTVRQAYAKVGEFWGRLLNLWVSVLLRVFGAAVTIILIPLVPLLCLWYAFCVQILLFEELPVRKVLKRSREMTKGIRWKIFLTFVLMTLLTWIMSFVVSAPILFLQNAIVPKGQLAPVWLSLLGAVLGAFGGAIASPPMMVAITMLYYNTRVVQEGFDLQIMLDRLGPPNPVTTE